MPPDFSLCLVPTHEHEIKIINRQSAIDTKTPKLIPWDTKTNTLEIHATQNVGLVVVVHFLLPKGLSASVNNPRLCRFNHSVFNGCRFSIIVHRHVSTIVWA